MRMIDVGGTLHQGMWHYVGLFPPVVIRDFALPSIRYQTYNYLLEMPLHSSTYLETAAHLYPDAINIHELPLERSFLNAVVLHIPLEAHGQITADRIRSSLAQEGETVRPQEALIINTGWYHRIEQPDYSLDPPFFATDAIEWILDHDVGLLGSDSTRFDSRLEPQEHLVKFFQKRDVLMLACMTNLDEVRRCRVKLIVLPLKVNVCVAPCRAIVLEDFHGNWPV